jgi:hypothetical protein
LFFLILLSFFNGIQAESKQKGSIAHYCSKASGVSPVRFDLPRRPLAGVFTLKSKSKRAGGLLAMRGRRV